MATVTAPLSQHAVVSHQEWIQARKEFLAKEKEFTRQRDELSRQRRELPWEKVEKPYEFEGPAGKLTLADLNEEGADLLSLQTRQQLGIQALSFAGQNEKAVLSLFR